MRIAASVLNVNLKLGQHAESVICIETVVRKRVGFGPPGLTRGGGSLGNAATDLVEDAVLAAAQHHVHRLLRGCWCSRGHVQGVCTVGGREGTTRFGSGRDRERGEVALSPRTALLVAAVDSPERIAPHERVVAIARHGERPLQRHCPRGTGRLGSTTISSVVTRPGFTLFLFEACVYK